MKARMTWLRIIAPMLNRLILAIGRSFFLGSEGESVGLERSSVGVRFSWLGSGMMSGF